MCLFDGLHDDLGNRDDNGDDGAHGDAHGVAAHVDALMAMLLMPPMKFSWVSHIYPPFSTSPCILCWINKAV